MKNRVESQNPLVSVITPCFNGEDYLERFLQSLSKQTYNNIEFIFVNDGSTDKTEIIFNNFKSRLNFSSIIYIYQKNKGLAGAIDKGLKYFTGKYIIWPDCDDILYENHIEEKVRFMEDNPDLAVALSDIDFVNEDDILCIIRNLDIDYDKCKFENILDRKSWMWLGLNGIIRASLFLKVYPDRNIPICRLGAGGQNCQMYLPLLYKYKYGIINKSLATYVIRKNSHSRKNFIYIHRCLQFCEIWIKTILRLDTNKIIKIKFCLRVVCNESRHIIQYYHRKLCNIFK